MPVKFEAHYIYNQAKCIQGHCYATMYIPHLKLAWVYPLGNSSRRSSSCHLCSASPGNCLERWCWPPWTCNNIILALQHYYYNIIITTEKPVTTHCWSKYINILYGKTKVRHSKSVLHEKHFCPCMPSLPLHQITNEEAHFLIRKATPAIAPTMRIGSSEGPEVAGRGLLTACSPALGRPRLWGKAPGGCGGAAGAPVAALPRTSPCRCLPGCGLPMQRWAGGQDPGDGGEYKVQERKGCL